MEVFNQTGLSLGWIPARLRPPGFTLTLIIKGTFTLTPGEPARLAPEDQRHFLDGDRFHADNPALGPVYDSDFAPFKPRADVFLVGTCHTPHGRPLPVAYASIEIGALRKRVAVVGDRRWSNDGPSAVPSEPRPFSAMPLRYDRSYGGPAFPKNPIGRGQGLALPNIELPGRMITSPLQNPDPAGFGPLDRRWARRSGNVGTYDDRWLAERWPGFPEDFDFGYFNAAPADQQIEGYLRGDELITLENLHRDHPRFESRLPGRRVRCFLKADPRRGNEFREVAMHLDTLWIDADAEKVILVWRGITSTTSLDAEEVQKALVILEDLADPPAPARLYGEAHLWQRPEEPIKKAEPERVPATPPPDPGGVEAEVNAALDETRAMLEKAKVPGDMLDKLKGVTNPDQFMAILLAELPHDPEAVARVEAEAREHTRKLLVDQGYDPSILDEPEPANDAAPQSPWTREFVAARAEKRGSFVDAQLAGLDLSGLDLRGLSFNRADLRGVNLQEARLDGADLSAARLERADLRRASLADLIAEQAELFQADLTGADLSRANLAGAGMRSATLAGAKLIDADLTGAILAKANLERASLEGAEMADVNLAEANLHKALGRRAHLARANLTGVDMREAAFDGADFSGCSLDRASFGNASLRDASFYGAKGDKISMVNADLSGLRAGEGASFWRGEFKGARADGSNWSGSALREADFREASLIRADFSGADLSGANLHRAILKHGILRKAKLHAALLTAANLFQGTLESAQLVGTDLRSSNLYGCELLDAVMTEAKLDGANLKATKLAGRMK